MAWPFREKQEDKPAGTENQPNTEGNEPSEQDKFLETLSGRFTELLKPLQEDNKALRQELESMKQASSRPPASAEDPADPISEPERWKMENLGPLAAQNVALSARLTEREVLDAVPQEWRDVVVPQVREMLDKNTPLSRKAQPDYASYVQNCVDLVVGRELLKGGVRRDTSNGKFFIEDASGRTEKRSVLDNSEFNWQDRKGRTHTGKEVLEKLGIDPQEFMKSGAIQ